MRTPIYSARTGLIAVALFALCGCSTIENQYENLFGSGPAQPPKAPIAPPAVLPPPPKAEPPRTTKVVIEKLDGPISKTAVEVLWQVPADPVDGFIVYYGYDRSDLRYMEKVYSSDVERVTDPDHGTVHRYILENLPPQKTMYVAIAAFIGEATSERTQVFEVPGETVSESGARF